MGKVTVHRYEESEASVRNILKPSVFLAGPTVRGHQPHLTSWRFAAIEEFEKQGFDGDLIVPEFSDKKESEFSDKKESDKGKEWVPLWEYNGLKQATCIMFWIPRTRELIGLTTNMEFGYWQAREPDKLVYGRPDEAYRMGYLDIMWKEVSKDMHNRLSFEPHSYITKNSIYKPEIYKTLEDTVKASIARAYRDWPMTNG